MPPVIRPLARGASFLGLRDDRFKTARLTAVLLLPLAAESASSNAVLPSLLQRSSRDYPTYAALRRRLNELYGARIVADVARLGDTQALLLTAASLDDRFALLGERVAEPCARLLCSMLFHPLLPENRFPTDAVEQERRCLIEQIESEINDKRRFARRRCEELLCAGEGYAVSRYGTRKGVEALTPEGLADAWRTMLQTAQVRVICQSAGQTEGLERAFAEELQRVTGRAPVSCAADAGSRFDGQVKTVSERMDVNQAKLVMGFRRTGDAPHDVPAHRLMAALLGGTPHSLLFRHVREELSLCYYCAAAYDRFKGVMLVDSGVEAGQALRVREEVLRWLDAAGRGDFSDEELENARRSLINQFLSVTDSPFSVGSWYLGQSLDAAVSPPEQAADELKAVTRERVAAAARRMALGAVYLLSGKEGAHA